MYRRIALLVTGIFLLSVVPMYGQNSVLSQMYGNGVHAYFAGKYAEAHGYFTSAIDGGTKDPRCYYFRGLSYQMLGRDEEAKADFAKGAELETADINNFYNVGRALQRIQGTSRLEIEKYRANARMEALERAEATHKARYQAIQEKEQEVLRTQAAAAPEAPMKLPATPEPPDEPAAAPAPAPFEEVPAEKPVEKPAEKPAEAMPTEKPAEEPADPFGAAPAAEKPADAPMEQPAEKPADAPAAPDDPFGAAPAAEKPADAPMEQPAEEPAAEQPKATGVLDAVLKSAAKAGGEAVDAAVGTVGAATKTVGEATGAGPAAPAAPDGGQLPGLPDEPATTEQPADMPAEQPAAKEAPADPFGAAPAATPAADMPAEQPAAAAEQPAADTPAADPADPFGAAPAKESADGPADPFSEEPADKPATEEKKEEETVDPADPFAQ